MDAEKIYHELTQIKVAQALMNDDLRDHIKRTELLENALLPIHNAYTIGKWVVSTMIGTVTLIGVVLEILKHLK